MRGIAVPLGLAPQTTLLHDAAETADAADEDLWAHLGGPRRGDG